MSSSRNIIQRKAELAKEIDRLERELQSNLVQIRSQALQEAKPTTIIKKFPLQAVAVLALAGFTSVLVAKGLQSTKRKQHNSDDGIKHENSSSQSSNLTSSASPSSLKHTLRSELQRVVVQQVVKGLSSYVEQTLHEKKSVIDSKS